MDKDVGIRTFNVLSLCSGGGGLELGLRMAVGGSRVVCYVEREGYAIEVLASRMEEGWLDDAPIWTDAKSFDGRRWRGVVDCVTGGYPCFVAGTLVLCKRGYVPIEEVRVGDLVLTHRARWKPVTAVMRKDGAPIREIKAQGVPGIRCTEEHPFFARCKQKGRQRSFGSPDWVQAKELTGTHWVSQALPPVRSDKRSREFWWLVGRYLADGWLQKSPSHRNGRVNICCDRPEADELERRIQEAGFSACRSEERTTTRFAITRAGFFKFLQKFGRYSHGKYIPGKYLSLSEGKARALLEGYLSGDGGTYRNPVGKGGFRRVQSASKALALSVALLSQRAFGVIATIRCQQSAKDKVIEGRLVRQRPAWVVSIPDCNRVSFVDQGLGWKRVSSNAPVGQDTVYNIAVRDDESYMADGAVVHNCQPFSCAGRIRGKEDPRHLWPSVKRIVEETNPGVLFFENVPNHVNVGFDEVARDLQGLGYDVEAGLFSAEEVGLCHVRKRLFIVGARPGEEAIFRAAEWAATANGGGERRQQDPRGAHGDEAPHEGRLPEDADQPPGRGEDVERRVELSLADAERAQRRPGDEHRAGSSEGTVGERQPPGAHRDAGEGMVAGFRGPSGTILPLVPPGPGDLEGWGKVLAAEPLLEPALCRMADGVASGMDRLDHERRTDQLRLLGNGVVPIAAACAFGMLSFRLASRW